MNNWKYRLFQFMQGRYGIDELGRFLLILSMIVVLLSNFRHLHILYLPGILLLAYTYFRVVSRNIFKRQQENQKFLRIKGRFSRENSVGSGWKSRKRKNTSENDGSQYNFYRCRNCGQTVRVPKGKGTVKITCPGCGNSFIDRT